MSHRRSTVRLGLSEAASRDQGQSCGPSERPSGRAEPLPCEVATGDGQYTLACLDFGPGGVDGWIGRHILAEQSRPTLARPIGQGEARDGSLVFTLTAREQEVLGLLAEGMTNAQLARVLFISERTANRHISNIFAELGVHNRTQAARAAVAAGLAG